MKPRSARLQASTNESFNHHMRALMRRSRVARALRLPASRATGVPLLEIVSEPDMRSAREAAAYGSELRRIVRFLGISDGNMAEGSMRCDVNVSVRPKGSPAFGTKVEVKNMNSFSNMQKAIEFEIERQVRRLGAAARARSWQAAARGAAAAERGLLGAACMLLPTCAQARCMFFLWWAGACC